VSARDAATLGLSVVVPVYNEEESVGPLHEEVRAAADRTGRSWELLMVDDGSVDATADRLAELAARDPRVRVLRLRRNYGQTAAIQAGFDHAAGAVVVTMDGDLQNDPAEIPRLVEAIAGGYDLVSGWRRDRQDSLARRIPSVVANWLISRLTGVAIHDNGCTLKAYRRELVKKARLYGEMHRFLAPMLTLSGCRTLELEVNHRARRYGRSKYGMSRIWKVFLDLLMIKMLLGFSTRPALWFALLAIPFALGAAASLGASTLAYAADGATVGGGVALVLPSIAVLCTFAALHLMLLGLFAELLVKVGDFREADTLLPTLLRRFQRS
jgi:glycosyltransferase involved in cell wall biosynthesis